jgi:hypothetical protein
MFIWSYSSTYSGLWNSRCILSNYYLGFHTCLYLAKTWLNFGLKPQLKNSKRYQNAFPSSREASRDPNLARDRQNIMASRGKLSSAGPPGSSGAAAGAGSRGGLGSAGGMSAESIELAGSQAVDPYFHEEQTEDQMEVIMRNRDL